MGKGLDFDELFPGRFMKAGQFKGRDVTLTITAVDRENLGSEKEKDVRPILSFQRTEKMLVLNKTNGLCLLEMFGRATGEWVGKRVTLYPEKIDYEGHDLAVRVRGSPDLPQDITFTLALAKKKPRKVTLRRTAGKAAPTQSVVPPPPPAPEPVPSSDVPFGTDTETEPSADHDPLDDFPGADA